MDVLISVEVNKSTLCSPILQSPTLVMFYDESSDEIQSKLELFDVELIFLGQISRFYF